MALPFPIWGTAEIEIIRYIIDILLGIYMIQILRIRLARWILGKHCPCYQMGYHNMIDFKQCRAERLAKVQQGCQVQ